MKSIANLLMLASTSAFAQLDRAGNVIESDGYGGGGNAVEGVLTGIFIGACIGMLYAKHQQHQGKEFATDGGAVIGGLIGMIAWPILNIFLK